MRRFHFFIDDLNHSRPLEMTVELGDVALARALAEEILGRSPTHIGIEVCEDGRRVFGLGTFANRTHCGIKSASGACRRFPQPQAGRESLALPLWGKNRGPGTGSRGLWPPRVWGDVQGWLIPMPHLRKGSGGAWGSRRRSPPDGQNYICRLAKHARLVTVSESPPPRRSA